MSDGLARANNLMALFLSTLSPQESLIGSEPAFARHQTSIVVIFYGGVV